MPSSTPDSGSHFDLFQQLSLSVEFYSGDFDAFAAKLCASTSTTLGVLRARVWTIDTDLRVLKRVCGNCQIPQVGCQEEFLPLGLAQPVLSQLLQSRSLVVSDVAQLFGQSEIYRSYFQPNQVGAIIYSMIHCGPEIVGVLGLEHSGAPREWTEAETYLTGVLADLLGNTYALRERNRLLSSLEKQNKILEERVKTRTQDLQDVLENQKALLRGICHDIANSVNVITATCELIHRRGDMRFIGKAQTAADMIKNMLQQTRAFCLFTDWGQKQAEDQHSFQQPLHLADILDKALFVLGDKARMKGLEVVIDPSVCRETQVLGEPLTLLHSVVCNILSNAIKFSPQYATLEIKQVQNEDMIGLVVRDYGDGMSPEKISDLLNSQTRIQSEEGTFSESGTGYGIIQVRHYLKKFGGELGICSWKQNVETKSGTEMTIWLRSKDHKQAAA
ncbi:MAG: GAF domain-containing sensor histidine kinase [Bdellovibrionaceae bacterium]|nr:GAF domain-containing sensor histidine kinase [Bdellovibrionales bacterium]MCB9084084.1 GAF domain-containing sensor histidine kinase [Pseudobdellovibrionaceae bacterium]